MTHVYIQPLPTRADVDSLPEWRRKQAMAYRHEQGQAECAASYLLLCRALSEVYSIDVQPDFTVGEHGKPALKQYPGVHFNMSHCKRAVAVAVADSPVGIDIERVGRYSESVARYAFNDREINEITQSADPQLEFTRLWTRKEAVAKMTGAGITDDMRHLLDNTEAHIATRDLTELECVVSVAQSAHKADNHTFIIIDK